MSSKKKGTLKSNDVDYLVYALGQIYHSDIGSPQFTNTSEPQISVAK